MRSAHPNNPDTIPPRHKSCITAGKNLRPSLDAPDILRRTQLIIRDLILVERQQIAVVFCCGGLRYEVVAGYGAVVPLYKVK